MSANYWSSTQRKHWKFSREQLVVARQELKLLETKIFGEDNLAITQNPIKYDHNLRIYLHNLVMKLGRKLCVRQTIIATLEIFILRFLIHVSEKEVNVYMLVTTLIYVACKIEEYPQHIRSVLNESRNLWPEYIPNDLTKIAEFEFYLIEELNSYLIVHHPYQNLVSLISIFNDETNDLKISLSDEEVQMCWSVINDSYITDVALLYPPHIVLIMSVYFTILLRSETSKDQDVKVSKLVKFLLLSNIDLQEVIETTQEMLTLYEQWESYDEHQIKKNLHQLLMALSRTT